MQCEIAMKIVTEKIKTMTKELRKRFEEAAERKAGCKSWLCYERSEKCKEMCIKYKYARECMEQGYMEAIAMAKEWLLVNGVFSRKTCGELKQYLSDFETYMSKLWEEKK